MKIVRGPSYDYTDNGSEDYSDVEHRRALVKAILAGYDRKDVKRAAR